MSTYWIVWACVTTQFQNASFKFIWFCFIFTSFARKTPGFLLICLFLLITKVFKRILFGKNIRLCAFNYVTVRAFVMELYTSGLQTITVHMLYWVFLHKETTTSAKDCTTYCYGYKEHKTPFQLQIYFMILLTWALLVVGCDAILCRCLWILDLTFAPLLQGYQCFCIFF